LPDFSTIGVIVPAGTTRPSRRIAGADAGAVACPELVEGTGRELAEGTGAEGFE